MGNKDRVPESQSAGLGDSTVSKGVVSILQGRISGARQAASWVDEMLSLARQSLQWSMPREIRVAWSSTLGCGARLSQQWSGACLSYTLKVVFSTLLGLFISVLAPTIG